MPLSDFYAKSYIKKQECPVCKDAGHDCFVDEDGHWPILGWVIFYGDGQFYTSKEYSVEDLPCEDVQIIKVYIQKEGKVRTIIDLGEDDYQLPGSDRILYGRWLGSLKYPEAYKYITHLALKHEWVE